MNAGKLKDRITVQARGQTQDAYGEPLESWTDVLSAWGLVEELRGREYFSDARVAADVDTRVTMRYRSEIAPAQRIVVSDGRVLDIKAPIADAKKTKLEILCKRAA